MLKKYIILIREAIIFIAFPIFMILNSSLTLYSGLTSFLSSLVSTSVSLGGGDIRKLLKLSGRLRSLLAHNGCVTSFNDMILEVRESLSVSDCF